jgi:GntR family transcriptional repressor for pyruvate dehydrogenase complex
MVMTLPLGKLERRDAPATEVARKILEYLLSSDIQPGAKLPSERQLASSLDIGRSAVRDALRPLTWLGIIEVRQGDGTYLRGMSSDLLPKVIEWGLLLGEKRVLDLVEARRHLEVAIAELAAERCTPSQAREIRAALERMASKRAERQQFVDADIDFHLTVADVAGNTVLSGILSSIQSLLRVWMERITQAPEDQESAYAIHVPIADAIEARDRVAAAAAMARHLDFATERLLATLAQPDADDGGLRPEPVVASVTGR